MRCTFVCNPKRSESVKCHRFLDSLIVYEHFFIRETMLSVIFRKSDSFRRGRFPKPRIFTISRRAQKSTSIISRKSTENRMTKGMGFYSDLKSVRSTAFGRMVPED